LNGKVASDDEIESFVQMVPSTKELERMTTPLEITPQHSKNSED
jgi:hypothetical protein